MSAIVAFASLADAVGFLQEARRAAHEGSCPPGGFPCAACVPVTGAVAALDIIRGAGGAASACRPARLALHDLACINRGECDDRDDHARRQDGHVRELRRFVATGGRSAR
jgi:hypothetical protein